jgi:hypothetical protein
LKAWKPDDITYNNVPLEGALQAWKYGARLKCIASIDVCLGNYKYQG